MRLTPSLLAICLAGCSCSSIKRLKPPSVLKSSTKVININSQKIESEGSLRILHFETEVNDDSAEALIKSIEQANDDTSIKIILIEINSGGGSVDAGLSISKSIERSNIPISCVVDGEADSMAFYILQSCDIRMMTRRSVLMIHGPAIYTNFGGQYGEWQGMADRLRTLEQAMIEHMARKLSISPSELEKRLKGGGEIWLNWKESQSLKAVDLVVATFTEAKFLMSI